MNSPNQIISENAPFYQVSIFPDRKYTIETISNVKTKDIEEHHHTLSKSISQEAFDLAIEISKLVEKYSKHSLHKITTDVKKLQDYHDRLSKFGINKDFLGQLAQKLCRNSSTKISESILSNSLNTILTKLNHDSFCEALKIRIKDSNEQKLTNLARLVSTDVQASELVCEHCGILQLNILKEIYKELFCLKEV